MIVTSISIIKLSLNKTICSSLLFIKEEEERITKPQGLMKLNGLDDNHEKFKIVRYEGLN